MPSAAWIRSRDASRRVHAATDEAIAPNTDVEWKARSKSNARLRRAVTSYPDTHALSTRTPGASKRSPRARTVGTRYELGWAPESSKSRKCPEIPLTHAAAPAGTRTPDPMIVASCRAPWEVTYRPAITAASPIDPANAQPSQSRIDRLA